MQFISGSRTLHTTHEIIIIIIIIIDYYAKWQHKQNYNYLHQTEHKRQNAKYTQKQIIKTDLN